MAAKKTRSELIEKMERIMERFGGQKPSWPPIGCKDVTTHLAGGWFIEHVDQLLEELRNAESR